MFWKSESTFKSRSSYWRLVGESWKIPIRSAVIYSVIATERVIDRTWKAREKIIMIKFNQRLMLVPINAVEAFSLAMPNERAVTTHLFDCGAVGCPTLWARPARCWYVDVHRLAQYTCTCRTGRLANHLAAHLSFVRIWEDLDMNPGGRFANGSNLIVTKLRWWY